MSGTQLAAGGITRHGLARLSRDWRRVGEGIYLTGAVTWEAVAWAGLLRGGAGAVLGAAAAANAHGLLRDPPRVLHVWAPTCHGDLAVDHLRVRFRRGRRTGRGRPPRTSVEVSLLDLADVSEENATVAAMASALADHKTRPERILTELGGRVRTRHSRVIRGLCEESSKGIESALEWRFHRRVLMRHGLPIPERQARTNEGRVDGLYREQRLIVELDGMRDHSDWSKDMMRDNRHAIDGLVTLRYGWHAVEGSTCAVAAQVAEALALQGGRAGLRRCPECSDGLRGRRPGGAAP